jgi:hypothetical protein
MCAKRSALFQYTKTLARPECTVTIMLSYGTTSPLTFNIPLVDGREQLEENGPGSKD